MRHYEKRLTKSGFLPHNFPEESTTNALLIKRTFNKKKQRKTFFPNRQFYVRANVPQGFGFVAETDSYLSLKT